MPKTRLFVGGLSEKVDEDALGSRLSQFGTVSGIDLKERTDADGNVMLKFSYVNIDAPSSKIDECIRQLNGCSWQGSRLRVEPAKESFLDRLSRERASIQQKQQYSSHPEKIDKSPTITLIKPIKNDDSSINVQRSLKDCEVGNAASFEEGIKKKKKKHKTSNRESNASEISLSEVSVPTIEAREEKRKKKRRSTEYNSATEPESPMFAQRKSNKKHKAEEEMLSSFKQFSSVWADSDDDTNDQNKSNSNIGDMKDGRDEGFFLDLEPDKLVPAPSVVVNKKARKKEAKQTVITETELGKKYVKVDKDLNFSKKSSGFSLLAQFSQQMREERKEPEREELLVPIVAPSRPNITAQPRVKTKPFFLQPGDRQIEGAIVWMAQSLTSEVEKEFAEVLPQLRSLYKTRSIRAMREVRNSRSRGRGGKRGRGRSMRAGAPYRDHRWREKKPNEKILNK